MKNKLNAIEALIFKSLIDSYISHDEFVSVNSALKEYNEIKRRNIKFCGIYIKTIEMYCASCKKYTANDNLSVTKLNKLDKCFYRIVLFVARKNQLLLKIKNLTILIIFEMINLKWIDSLTNFYWLETNICKNCI